jgi:8-hydroxy-5-deazaflavin:NADPH oxidoreductase
MKLAIFGTGIVGQTFAEALAKKGHTVVIGTRDPAVSKTRADKPFYGEPFSVWYAQHRDIAVATYAEAAAQSEIIFNCTNGAGSLPALEAVGAEALGNKLLIDVTNPLDFSKGMPPSLFVSNTDSLAEQIQRAYPKLRVVKTLNTMNCGLMVNPRSLKDGNHTAFVSGNDAAAKAQVKGYLTEWFGWKGEQVIDLGDITTARGTEQLLPIWLRLFGALNTGNFNFAIVK